jgi:hypothetical protein
MKMETRKYIGNDGGILKKKDGSKIINIKGKIEIIETCQYDPHPDVASYGNVTVTFDQDIIFSRDDVCLDKNTPQLYSLEASVMYNDTEGKAIISEIYLKPPNLGEFGGKRGTGKVNFINDSINSNGEYEQIVNKATIPRNANDKTSEMAIQAEARNNKLGKICGMLCIILGFVLLCMGVTGVVNWNITFWGISSSLISASSGIPLVIVGFLIIWKTDLNIIIK